MSEALLVLADGTTFTGKCGGGSGRATGEVVFNTSMTGYQEMLTDPSYAGQLLDAHVSPDRELRVRRRGGGIGANSAGGAHCA